VGGDHREAVAQGHHDLGLDAGQLGPQHHVAGDGALPTATGVVVPVHPPQVERVRLVRADRPERPANGGRHRLGPGQLGERRQQHLRLTEVLHRTVVDLAVDDMVFKSQSGHVPL
jgi:hypothetical protein